MRLCIAEKPSVAKEIARILGANIRCDGYFEGNGYRVSWTFGHLCTLKLPEDYAPELKRWSVYTLPIIPPHFQIKVIDDNGVRKQFETLKRLFQECDEIINCGDAGIEGELIQRWVMSLAKNTHPVKRLWISSLTESAIREGFANLKEGKEYDLLYYAGHARAVSDWLLGINATRLYTVKYSNGKGVLSIGRVQTPTLALIVKRHHEIQDFKPETYWELKTVYRETTFSASKGRFSSVEEAQQTLQKISGSLFKITSFEKKKGNEAPPRLFDLTSLQVDCNRKFSFSAEETLNLIQSLYEKKQVSYPRVDTTYLPNDVYPKIPSIMKGLKPYGAFTQSILAGKIKKSKKVFDDSKITDHHAIIPTGEFNPNLSPNEKLVFDLIIRRFIAAFYPDSIVANTTVLGEVEDIEFKATGKQILEDGWRVLFQKGADNSKEEQLLPAFEKGEEGPHEPGVQEKQTQPPKPYTEATLLRAMETAGKQVDDEELRDLMKENGIGRPSTRANIIETLFKRHYIRRNRKNLEPTITGIELIGTINNELLKSVELTGQWEQKLRLIERNQYKAEDFILEMKEMIRSLVREVKAESRSRSVTIEETVTGKKEKQKEEAPLEKEANVCPVCGKGEVLKGGTAYGCSNYKNGCRFRIPFTFQEKKLTQKQVDAIILKKKTPLIKGFKVDGQKCNGRILLNEKGELVFEKEMGTDSKESTTSSVPKEDLSAAPKSVHATNSVESVVCPVCHQGLLLQGKTAFGCSRWKEGCHFKIDFEAVHQAFPGKELNQTLLQEYLKRNSFLNSTQRED